MFNKRRPPGKTENDFDQNDDYVEMTEEEAATDAEQPAWEDATSHDMYEEDDLEGLDKPAPQRRASPLASILPIATAAVVGVVGLGYVYTTYVAAPAAPAVETPADEAGVEPVITQLPGTGGDTTAPEGAVSLTPEQAPTEIAPEVAAPELATEPEPALTSSLTGAPVTEPAVEAPLEPVVEAQPPVAEAPLAVTEPAPVAPVKAPPIEAAPAPVAAPPVPAVPVVAEPKVDVAAMAAADLGVRLEALEKRLDQVSVAADKAPAAEQSAIQALDQDIRGLKSDLGSLKSTLDQVSKRLNTLESRPAPVAAAPAAAAPKVVIAPAAPTPAAPKVETKKAPATAAAAAKPAAPAPTWSLRAAQPGEAWVSEGQSKELRKVGVGDTLPGVGKINQIRQVSGRWEIVGSQATIRQ